MVTLILFIILLGSIIFIHEGGHFLFAKLTGIYVYEFALGMGPKLFSFKKGETVYSLRAIPIGGFCQLAGEEGEEEDLPKDRTLPGKKPWQKFLVMFFGAGFNFISAILVLFFISLVWGSTSTEPILSSVEKGTPAYDAGLRKGDEVLEINGHDIWTIDDISLYLAISDGNESKATEFKVKHKNGDVKTYDIKPEKTKVDGEERDVYGIGMVGEEQHGFLASLKYTVIKTGSLFKQMWVTLLNLFTGGIRLSQLSGPVGIYEVVGTQASAGIASLLYLFSFLSINVGFINLLPLPAFDGGHILFIIIEKIKGSPVKPETEAKFHATGLFLLMLLMIYVTFYDILRLF